METYLDAIALGHLNPSIRENALAGTFFLQCTLEDLQAIGIGQVQWKKSCCICHCDKPAVGGDAPSRWRAVLLDVGGATTGPVRPRGRTANKCK